MKANQQSTALVYFLTRWQNLPILSIIRMATMMRTEMTTLTVFNPFPTHRRAVPHHWSKRKSTAENHLAFCCAFIYKVRISAS